MYTKVVGVTHKNADGSSRQRILKRMRREERDHERVYLEHEPENPYDENAVKVLNTDCEQLGYLERSLAADIVGRAAKGETFSAVITGFTGGEEGRPTVGCNLEITSSYSKDALKLNEDDGHLFRLLFVSVLISVVIVVLIRGDVSKKSASTWEVYTQSSSSASSNVEIDPILAKSLDKEAQERREAQRKAEAAQKKADAQELYELRKKMTSTFDEVERVKWIYAKTTKRLIDRRSSRKNFFYVYLGQSGNTMWPRLRMGFIKNGWIFFEKVIVNIDGRVTQLSFGHFDVRRDVLGGSTISEYIDIGAREHESLIKAMSKGKKVIVRFEGSQYRHDFTLTKEQKTALGDVWRLFELMR